MDSPEEDIIGFEDIQEETEDANEVEETQHMEGAENDEMDTQHTDGTDNNDVDIQNINTVEYADDFEDNMDDQTVEKMAQDKDLQVLLGEQENLMEDDLYGKTGKIILFSSPPDYR
ncbi:hypothetical protein ACS0PU_012016 [Formica fusca]